METPENEISDALSIDRAETAPRPAAVAPAWHTVLLLVFILFVSIVGVYRHPGAGRVNRLATYGVTAALEVTMLSWVALGVWLRKIPLRSLFGYIPRDIRSIALDMGIALVFWIGSLMVLATVAVAWLGVEAVVLHKPIQVHTGKVLPPDPDQQKAVRAVTQLAPSNGREIAAWMLLCLLVGVVEELVFRGYLQRQFIAWGRGSAAAGVVFSALAFGSAHGYEGVRNMFLLSVFGALFSLLALFRKSLRAGIFAHSWHDLVAGLTLALLHSRHLV
jgi:membrane protease YdiL (CAAX protease family)